MTSYSSHIKATDRLYDNILKKYIQRDDLHNVMKNIMDKYETEWRSEKNIFQVNINDIWKPRVLFAASERLQLAEMILPNKEATFEQKYLIPPVSEYLSLTCFDLLGQKSSWVPFEQWLILGKKQSERDAIFSKILETDYIKKTSLVFKEYQIIYGVKNSFFNFFDKLIDLEHRNELFSKMKIKIYNDYPNDLLKFTFGDEEEKKKYLFSIRNNFTHQAIHNTPNEYLLPGYFDNNDWWRREDLFVNKKCRHYFVHRNYLLTLKDTVKYGIYAKLIEMKNDV